MALIKNPNRISLGTKVRLKEDYVRLNGDIFTQEHEFTVTAKGIRGYDMTDVDGNKIVEFSDISKLDFGNQTPESVNLGMKTIVKAKHIIPRGTRIISERSGLLEGHNIAFELTVVSKDNVSFVHIKDLVNLSTQSGTDGYNARFEDMNEFLTEWKEITALNENELTQYKNLLNKYKS